MPAKSAAKRTGLRLSGGVGFFDMPLNYIMRRQSGTICDNRHQIH
jgi:hypothetical protein